MCPGNFVECPTGAILARMHCTVLKNVVLCLLLSLMEVSLNVVSAGWDFGGAVWLGVTLSTLANNHFHLLQFVVILVRGIVQPFLICRNLR